MNNYYAIIPADVRYDDRITADEKLLYGELTCLSNKHGFAFPSNAHLAELYGVAKETISRRISKLQDCGYIKIHLIYDGKQVKQRRIYIGQSIPHDANVNRGIDANVNRGIDANIKGNNTSINNTSINKEGAPLISNHDEKGSLSENTEETQGETREIISFQKMIFERLLPAFKNTLRVTDEMNLDRIVRRELIMKNLDVLSESLIDEFFSFRKKHGGVKIEHFNGRYNDFDTFCANYRLKGGARKTDDDDFFEYANAVGKEVSA